MASQPPFYCVKPDYSETSAEVTERVTRSDFANNTIGEDAMCRSTMKLIVSILLFTSLSSVALAQRNSFSVRYRGGSIETKTSKDEWNNKLTILSDEILLELKDGQKTSIDPKTVTSISYGRAATRHVARWVTLGILGGPIALMGLFTENVQHYVSIEYESAEGKKSGVLIQAHKDNYRNVLALLRGATGKEIDIDKKGKAKRDAV